MTTEKEISFRVDDCTLATEFGPGGAVDMAMQAGRDALSIVLILWIVEWTFVRCQMRKMDSL